MNPYLPGIFADIKAGKPVPHFRLTWAACLQFANGDAVEAERVMQFHYPLDHAAFMKSKWAPRPHFRVVP